MNLRPVDWAVAFGLAGALWALFIGAWYLLTSLAGI